MRTIYVYLYTDLKTLSRRIRKNLPNDAFNDVLKAALNTSVFIKPPPAQQAGQESHVGHRVFMTITADGEAGLTTKAKMLSSRGY